MERDFTTLQELGSDYYGLGADLHNVEDFYSHSNYVELYAEYYKNEVGDMSKFSVDKVPLFQDGIKDGKFREKYLKRKDNGLMTGDFHLRKNEKNPVYDKNKLGKDTHYRRNKDWFFA
jgi:hypothetical protein